MSGEHSLLPRAEVEAVLESEGVECKVALEDGKKRILVLDVESGDYDYVKRLALTKKAGIFYSISDDLEEIAEKVFRGLGGVDSFAVRCRSKKIEEKLGGLLAARGLKVNLDNPQAEVLCYSLGKKHIASLNIPLDRDYTSRLPQNRPFFHPTSMHPKIARLLVNLSRVSEGNSLLDPFCGTGGILIEAGLLGVKVKGFDVDGRMVDGCRKNLDFYGVEGDIEQGDALQLKGELKVDAVVSDLPYGRSSYLTGKDLDLFYKKFLYGAGGMLKKGGFLVCVLPKDIEIKSEKFTLRDKFMLYIHKSLTRRIYVLQKK